MEGDTVEYFGEVKKKCNGYVLSNATTQPAAAYAYEADVTKLWDAYLNDYYRMDTYYRLFHTSFGKSLKESSTVLEDLLGCLTTFSLLQFLSINVHQPPHSLLPT